jgi:hypothetical protein
MLNILFVPGSFGTTIQVLVYRFSSQYVRSDITSIDPCDVLYEDGSMHRHPSTGHVLDRIIIEKFFNGEFNQNVRYSNLLMYAELSCSPEYDYIWFLEGVKNFRKNDQTIFVSILDITQAEICLLYHFNKKNTAQPKKDYLGFQLNDIFDHWGLAVPNFTEKTQVELLILFSEYYPTMINKWIDANNHTDQHWLQVNILEMLTSTHDVFDKIIHYCGGIFDVKQSDLLYKFADTWREKQQYVLDEYDIINDTVDGILSGRLQYSPSMNFMAEAIILRKLKSNGYDINGTK